MEKSLFWYVKIMLANALFVGALFMLFYQLPTYLRVTEAVHAQTNRRLNSVEVNDGIGVIAGVSKDTLEAEQYPYMTTAEVYYDLLSYSGNKPVLLGDSGHTFQLHEIREFQENADSGLAYSTTGIAYYLDNCNSNAIFVKQETDTLVSYIRQ